MPWDDRVPSTGTAFTIEQNGLFIGHPCLFVEPTAIPTNRTLAGVEPVECRTKEA